MEEIKQQLRFYFSMSNLSNDNILLLKILYEKQLAPEFLLKFNKLNKLLQNFPNPSATLLQACSELPELQLTSGQISLKTEVTQEIIEKYREDSLTRTLYFENIPDFADTSLIKSLFFRFGEALYVSLPKWPETGLLKGFGFIELPNKCSCDEALSTLSNTIPLEFAPYSIPMKLLHKIVWLQYKERLQTLKIKLRADSPDREFTVLVTGLPEKITKTQISDMLEIKPWKIEYRQGSGKAQIVFCNSLDVEALLRCQPTLLGRQVCYSVLKNKYN